MLCIASYIAIYTVANPLITAYSILESRLFMIKASYIATIYALMPDVILQSVSQLSYQVMVARVEEAVSLVLWGSTFSEL